MCKDALYICTNRKKKQPFVESNVIYYKCNITSWRVFVKLHQMEREEKRMEGEYLMK